MSRARTIRGRYHDRMAGCRLVVDVGAGRDAQRVAVEDEQPAGIVEQGKGGGHIKRVFPCLETCNNSALAGVFRHRTTRSENNIRDWRVHNPNAEIFLVGGPGTVRSRDPHRVAGRRLVVDVGAGCDLQFIAFKGKQAASVINQRKCGADIKSVFKCLEKRNTNPLTRILDDCSTGQQRNVGDRGIGNLDGEGLDMGRSAAIAGGNAHRMAGRGLVVDVGTGRHAQRVAVEDEQTVRIIDQRKSRLL